MNEVDQVLEYGERLRQHPPSAHREEAGEQTRGGVAELPRQRWRPDEVVPDTPTLAAVNGKLGEEERSGSGEGAAEGARSDGRENHRHIEVLSAPKLPAART